MEFGTMDRKCVYCGKRSRVVCETPSNAARCSRNTKLFVQAIAKLGIIVFCLALTIPAYGQSEQEEPRYEIPDTTLNRIHNMLSLAYYYPIVRETVQYKGETCYFFYEQIIKKKYNKYGVLYTSVEEKLVHEITINQTEIDNYEKSNSTYRRSLQTNSRKKE